MTSGSGLGEIEKLNYIAEMSGGSLNVSSFCKGVMEAGGDGKAESKSWVSYREETNARLADKNLDLETLLIREDAKLCSKGAEPHEFNAALDLEDSGVVVTPHKRQEARTSSSKMRLAWVRLSEVYPLYASVPTMAVEVRIKKERVDETLDIGIKDSERLVKTWL